MSTGLVTFRAIDTLLRIEWRGLNLGRLKSTGRGTDITCMQALTTKTKMMLLGSRCVYAELPKTTASMCARCKFTQPLPHQAGRAAPREIDGRHSVRQLLGSHRAQSARVVLGLGAFKPPREAARRRLHAEGGRHSTPMTHSNSARAHSAVLITRAGP